jgi:hypothetical protein
MYLITIFDNSKVCITSDTIMIATVLCHVMRKKWGGGGGEKKKNAREALIYKVRAPIKVREKGGGRGLFPLCSTVPGIGFIPEPTEISFSHVLYILIVKLIFTKYSSSIDLGKGNTSMFTDDEGEITDDNSSEEDIRYVFSSMPSEVTLYFLSMIMV